MNSRHWWNGRWGRLVRRDVFASLTADGEWRVELCRGGPNGRSRTRSFGSERDAVRWIETALLATDAGWRELRAPADAGRSRKVAPKTRLAS